VAIFYRKAQRILEKKIKFSVFLYMTQIPPKNIFLVVQMLEKKPIGFSISIVR